VVAREWGGEREEVEESEGTGRKRAEMTQTLYAHMNKKKF
jgi:hypothetical protein